MKKEYIFISGFVSIGIILYFFRDNVKNIIIKSVKDFITKFLPLATQAANHFGFKDPYFLLAQMYAENSGNSTLLNTANNVGSLISRYNGQKLKTNQFWHGDDIVNPKNGIYFRKYDTLLNGFLDYANTLASYGMHNVSDIQQYASKISNSKYINESNGDNRDQYAKNILNTYNKLKSA
jgi:hypothetical protein